MNANGLSGGTASPIASEARIRVSIISDVRFLRECLADVFTREDIAIISGLFADLQEALPEIATSQSDIILVDEAISAGPAAVGQIRDIAPRIPVVVMAVSETAEKIITWAEAGVAGYIPRTAGLADVVPLLADIMRGKQPCAANVAGGLLRRVSNIGATNSGFCNMTSPPMLTPREAQITKKSLRE